MKRIKYCHNCKKYSLQDDCSCGAKTTVKVPMRYSPVDRLDKYRREARKEDLKKRGLI